MSRKFEATHEWQTVAEDQSIPAGCHVRINMETGHREAKLLTEENSSSQDTQLVPADTSVAAPSPTAARAADTHIAAAKEAARESYGKTMAAEASAGPAAGATGADARREERAPHSWEGLLKWSLSFMDGTAPSNFEEMDPQRRTWLEEALAAMNKDEIALMKEALKHIAHEYARCFDGTLTPEMLEEKENALEALLDLVDLIDNAQDLIPLGGYPAVIALLGCSYDSLVWRALDVLATTVQNNPVCQAYCLNQGMIGRFMQLAGPDVGSNTVRTKALYALSGLVRGNEEATKAFLLGNGLGLLHSCMSADGDQETLAIKATFMLNQLLIGEAVSGDAVAELGMVQSLVNLACKPGTSRQLREHCVATLYTLSNAGGRATEAMGAPELQAKERLLDVQKRLQMLPAEEREACADEIEHLGALQMAL